jgi:hypothetical protein
MKLQPSDRGVVVAGFLGEGIAEAALIMGHFLIRCDLLPCSFNRGIGDLLPMGSWERPRQARGRILIDLHGLVGSDLL